MKLKLQTPYSEDFKSGYVYTDSQDRKIVSLIREDGTRTSTSYARYLMSVEVGHYLDEDEEVDHINEDKTDDRLENLQILSSLENKRKSNSTGQTYLRCICPVCQDEFEVLKKQTFLSGNGTKKYQNCSRSCGCKAGHIEDSKLESNFEIIEKFKK
jgi:hypothetical protein